MFRIGCVRGGRSQRYWVRYGHFFFFFSSRRRHTRLQGDWSSDVCSSDLRLFAGLPLTNPSTTRTSQLAGRRGTACAPSPITISSRESSPGKRKYLRATDRKSTRLNSSHLVISYAVFCLKKKNQNRSR